MWKICVSNFGSTLYWIIFFRTIIYNKGGIFRKCYLIQFLFKSLLLPMSEYKKVVYIWKITTLHKVAKSDEKMFTVLPVSEEPCTKDIVKYFILFFNFIGGNDWFMQNPGAVYICKNLVQITWLLIFSGKWPRCVSSDSFTNFEFRIYEFFSRIFI